MPMLAPAVLLLGLWAQDPAAAPPPDCRADEHRQFDFWIGEWEVSAQGQAAGRNTIRAEQNGCVLRENWRSTRGFTGTSLNYYDRRDRRWHQVWIDGRGGALVLSGAAPAAGEMRLESDPAQPGPRQRISWRRREDGGVEQHWEQSSDGGASWSTAFLGEYRRADDD